MNPCVLVQLIDVFFSVMSALATDLTKHLDNIADMSSRECKQWLNTVKMATFLIVHLTEAMESHNNKPSKDALLTTKGRKRPATNSEDSSIGWEDQRGRVLLQLYSIVQLPLHRLCSPPIIEEDYVKCGGFVGSSRLNGDGF